MSRQSDKPTNIKAATFAITIPMLKKAFIFTCGLTVAIGGSYLAYRLLYCSKLSGSEFVALFLGSIILGAAIIIFDKVSELSIAGNSIKIRNLQNDASDIIKDLTTSRTQTYKLILRLIKKTQGGFFGDANETEDERSKDFYVLVEQIEDSNMAAELQDDIYEVATLLTKEQLNLVNNFSTAPFPIQSSTDFPDPILLEQSTKPKTDKIKLHELALREYRNVFKIWVKYK